MAKILVQNVVRKAGSIACPFCQHHNTALAGDCCPEDGDYAVCVECACVAIITVDESGFIGMRKPYGTEVIEAAQALSTLLENK